MDGRSEPDGHDPESELSLRPRFEKRLDPSHHRAGVEGLGYIGNTAGIQNALPVVAAWNGVGSDPRSSRILRQQNFHDGRFPAGKLLNRSAHALGDPVRL